MKKRSPLRSPLLSEANRINSSKNYPNSQPLSGKKQKTQVISQEAKVSKDLSEKCPNVSVVEKEDNLINGNNRTPLSKHISFLKPSSCSVGTKKNAGTSKLQTEGRKSSPASCSPVFRTPKIKTSPASHRVVSLINSNITPNSKIMNKKMQSESSETPISAHPGKYFGKLEGSDMTTNKSNGTRSLEQNSFTSRFTPQSVKKPQNGSVKSAECKRIVLDSKEKLDSLRDSVGKTELKNIPSSSGKKMTTGKVTSTVKFRSPRVTGVDSNSEDDKTSSKKTLRVNLEVVLSNAEGETSQEDSTICSDSSPRNHGDAHSNQHTSEELIGGNLSEHYTGQEALCKEDHCNFIKSVPCESPSKFVGSSTVCDTPEYFRSVSVVTPEVHEEKVEDGGTSSCTSEISNAVALRTPVLSRKHPDLRQLETSGEVSSAIRVAVRVRPFNNRELEAVVHQAVTMEGNETTVMTDTGQKFSFFYDHCLWSFNQHHPLFADQSTVYDLMADPLLNHAFEGYNTCLFAYGQTGSGKSFSIMGSEENPGIIPRFSQHLFDKIHNSVDESTKYMVEISYFEIYNEKIHDLLAPSTDDGKKAALRVREHPVLGPYVVDLSTYVVSSYEDLQSWLMLGNKQRATAATGMNDKSSRSHSIFIIVLTQTLTENIEDEEHEHSRKSKVNLVDLAGSERVYSTHTSGERLKEGVSINKSLLTLGKVISHLASHGTSGSSTSSSTQKKNIFVPYRESVLTWLLKESLGGNSRTAMIATISPCNNHVEETLSTLRYAQQARDIVNVARVNEDPKVRLIIELRAEVERLRSQQAPMRPEEYTACVEEIAVLKLKLQESQNLLDQTTRSWKEKLEEAEKRKQEETTHLQREGIALRVDGKSPCLVNLNEDPQLSETLLYLLHPGRTRIGRKDNSSDVEIQLHGNLLIREHCILENNEREVKVIPMSNAPVYVNGQEVTESTVLRHGDRLVVGGVHFFRLNNPCQSGILNGTSSKEPVKDYLFARDELLQAQETRLKQEVFKARDQARTEMLTQLQGLKEEAELELDIQRSNYEDQIRDLNIALKEKETKLQEAEKKKLMMKMEKPDCEPVGHDIEISPFKSNLLEEMIDLYSDVFTDLDTLKKQVAQTNLDNSTPSYHGDKSQSCELYALTLQIQEANHLAKELGKTLEFRRCDLMTDKGLDQGVKVLDYTHNVVTFWSTEKFAEKHQKLKKIAEGKEEEHLESEDVFDMNDVWERTEDVMPLQSPAVSKVVRSVRRLSQQGNFKKQLSLSSQSSSGGDTPRCRQSGTRQRSSGNVSTLNLSTAVTQSIAENCRVMVSQLADQLSGVTTTRGGTLLDRVLLAAHQLITDLGQLEITFEQPALLRNNEPVQKNIQWVSTMLHCLVNSVTCYIICLKNHATPGGCTQDKDRYFDSITHRIYEAQGKIANAVAFILQGIEKDIDSLILQWVSQAQRSTGRLIVVLGEVCAFVKDNPTWTILSEVDKLVCNNLMKGVVSLVSHVVQQTFDKTRDSESHVQALADDSFFGAIKESWSILRASQEAMAAIKLFLGKYQVCQPDDVCKTLCSNDSIEELKEFYITCVESVESLYKLNVQLVQFINIMENLVTGPEDLLIRKQLQSLAGSLLKSLTDLMSKKSSSDTGDFSSTTNNDGSSSIHATEVDVRLKAAHYDAATSLKKLQDSLNQATPRKGILKSPKAAARVTLSSTLNEKNSNQERLDSNDSSVKARQHLNFGNIGGGELSRHVHFTDSALKNESSCLLESTCSTISCLEKALERLPMSESLSSQNTSANLSNCTVSDIHSTGGSSVFSQLSFLSELSEKEVIDL
ncbi:uncharacterized protein LOC143228729 [Tachypleus tridentatus]|uniref:uncharacterized protein LOC143228729 n=1 Tax=Tachypleus tridentatus TaxID=6853 RepID=UPI003FD2BB05